MYLIKLDQNIAHKLVHQAKRSTDKARCNLDAIVNASNIWDKLLSKRSKAGCNIDIMICES